MPISSFIKLIDLLTEGLGRVLSYLSLLMVLLMAAVVLLRYGLNSNSIALQESVTYLHGVLFMLAAAYTLKHDGHVRVDIFYRDFQPATKAWINCLGTLVFLLPVCGYIFFSSLHYVAESWRVREASPLPGGLPGVFLLKSLIPLFAFTLCLQAMAEFIRNLLFLMTASTSELSASQRSSLNRAPTSDTPLQPTNNQARDA